MKSILCEIIPQTITMRNLGRTILVIFSQTFEGFKKYIARNHWYLKLNILGNCDFDLNILFHEVWIRGTLEITRSQEEKYKKASL